MNKAVFFLAALGASTALCASIPAENTEKRDTIPIARVPDVPPPSRETLDASIRKAADFLLKEQNRDGSWGSHTRTKGLNVICPYPEGPRSFRTASTSLCVIGLLTSPLKEDPAVKAALEDELKLAMAERGAEEMTAGAHRLSWKVVTSIRIDTAALKRTLPEIAARFTKESRACRFTIN